MKVTTLTVTPVKSLAATLVPGVALVSAVAGGGVAGACVAGPAVMGAAVTGAAVTGAAVTGAAVIGALVGAALLQGPTMSATIGNAITKRFFANDMRFSSVVPGRYVVHREPMTNSRYTSFKLSRPRAGAVDPRRSRCVPKTTSSYGTSGVATLRAASSIARCPISWTGCAIVVSGGS